MINKMETQKLSKIKFVKSDSPEQENLISDLVNKKEGLSIEDPNAIIGNLEFLVDNSFRRGSFGEYHESYEEYILQNCPLTVLIIFLRKTEVLNSLITENKIKLFNGEFAQYFCTFEAKDSNSVERFTFKNFHLAHLKVGFKYIINEKILTDEKCGEFEVQRKSNQYHSSSKEKYLQGYNEKILNCSLKEMIELDKKIDDLAENREIKKKKINKSKK